MTGTAIELLLARVASHGLTTAAPRWSGEPLDDLLWDEVLHGAHRQRLTGFLAWAVEDGFAVTESQRQALVDLHSSVLHSCLHLERLLLEVSTELLDHDIGFRVLKGPALSRWAYPDPAVRTFGDIDLLVASDDWDRMVGLFDARGYERSYGEPRPGWASRFAKGNVFRTDAGWELDIHRTFAGGPLGLSLDLHAVFADRAPIEIGGVALPALAPDAALLHACYNAALGDLPPRLVAARDVAQLFSLGSVDLDRVQQLAQASRAQAVVARAIGVTEELLGIDDLPLSDWARHHRRTVRERVALFAYTDPRRNTPRETALGLLAVPGLRPKVDYVWPLLFPQRSYLGERHGSRAARFRYAATRLTRGRRAGR